MGRTSHALFVVIASVALWAAPATADPAPADEGHRPPGLAVSGTFVGTSTYEFSQDPACNFVLEEYSGTYDPDRRGLPGGAFLLDVCVFLGAPQGLGVTGTFEITSGRLTLSGTVDGFLEPTESGSRIDLTLTVTGSRGTFVPLRGTIRVTGNRVEPALGTSDVEGTFAADLRPGRGGPG